jgi:hypothetical protein
MKSQAQASALVHYLILLPFSRAFPLNKEPIRWILFIRLDTLVEQKLDTLYPYFPLLSQEESTSINDEFR